MTPSRVVCVIDSRVSRRQMRELEIRVHGGRARVLGRDDGVFRTIQEIPARMVPAVLLRLTSRRGKSGWSVHGERHAGAISYIGLLRGGEYAGAFDAAFQEMKFPRGKMTVCRCASPTVLDDVVETLQPRKGVEVYSISELRTAVYGAIMGDRVCLAVLKREALPLREVPRPMLDEAVGDELYAEYRRRVCETCNPSGSGCEACYGTGLSGRVAHVTYV